MKGAPIDFDDAVRNVVDRLLSMSEGDFHDRLQSHKHGFFSQILLETGALAIRELDEWSDWDNYDFQPPPGGVPSWLGSLPWSHLETLNSQVELGSGSDACRVIKGSQISPESLRADDYEYNLAA